MPRSPVNGQLPFSSTNVLAHRLPVSPTSVQLPFEGRHRLPRRPQRPPQVLPLRLLRRGTSCFHQFGSSRRTRSARPLEFLGILAQRPQRHARNGCIGTDRIARTWLVLEPRGAESGEVTKVRLGGRRTGCWSREGKLMPRRDAGCHWVTEAAEVGRHARAGVLSIWDDQLRSPEHLPSERSLVFPGGCRQGLTYPSSTDALGSTSCTASSSSNLLIALANAEYDYPGSVYVSLRRTH